jgi:predicted PurR-regulated permease PerM
MNTEKATLNNTSAKEKIITIIIIIAIFMTLWYMLDLALLTFIFTYLFYSLWGLIKRRHKKIIPIIIPDPLIILVLYIIFIGVLFAISYQVVPVIINQLSELWKIISNFNIVDLKDDLDPRVYEIVSRINFETYVSDASFVFTDVAKKIGSFSLTIFMSLVLSLFLLLENNKIKIFGKSLENSKIATIYNHFINFGSSFVNSFGKVMQVQLVISLINTILSCIVLIILGFPQIVGLAVMIFALGLIPVMGVIISFIPLSIIAFNIGGVTKVIAVVILIILIHTMETYILNPKLMADKTKLPVCFIFIVLIVGEHFLGTWGLLIGVPIFIFLLDIMDIKYIDLLKINKKNPKDIEL